MACAPSSASAFACVLQRRLKKLTDPRLRGASWGKPARAGRGLYSGRAAENGAPGNLLQRGVDRGEFGIELGAQSVHRRDNHKGNTGGNQAILDGRGRGLVFQKSGDNIHAGSHSVILSKQTVLDR